MARKHKRSIGLEWRQERVEPTPETLARLRPNPLADLPKELQMAAELLRESWLIITGPAAAGLATYERVHTGIGGLKLSHLSEWQSDALERYCLWSEEMARYRLPTRPIVAICAEDKLPEEVLIPQLGFGTIGKIMKLVCEGLEIFDGLP